MRGGVPARPWTRGRGLGVGGELGRASLLDSVTRRCGEPGRVGRGLVGVATAGLGQWHRRAGPGVPEVEGL